MDNFEIYLRQMNEDKYYTIEDLRMNRKYGFLLSDRELNNYLSYKDNNDDNLRIELPLIAWNSKKVYYYRSFELLSKLSDYYLFFKNDMDLNNSYYVERNIEEVSIGLIASELEGTLRLEGVNTTRRQIERIIADNNPKDDNSRIVLNMHKGLKYISTKPVFNKDNLKKLNDILSEDCLSDDLKLDDYYRNDVVYIGDHIGCPYHKIEECMNSLFEYVNSAINNPKDDIVLVPFIVHYYIVYIHPYFDYNGRTARMVQIWLFLLLDSIPALFLSEAIDHNKKSYYQALDDSRYTHNDLSYLLIYLVNLTNTYSLLHKNLDNIKRNIESEGETITQSELHYLKCIILNRNTKWFNYKRFIEFGNLDITKQAALKVLNSLEAKGLLKTKLNSSKEKIFILNDDIIEFELK